MLSDAIALRGFQNIAEKFSTKDSYGPVTVRRFLSESTAQGDMTEDQVFTRMQAISVSSNHSTLKTWLLAWRVTPAIGAHAAGVARDVAAAHQQPRLLLELVIVQ